MPAPDTPTGLPIWPSGIAQLHEDVLEITTGEGIRVAAADILRIEFEPPRAGRLQLTLEYRAGLDRRKTSRWVEARHEQALHRLVEAVAAASGAPAASSKPPRRWSVPRSRTSGLAVLAVAGALAATGSVAPDASAATQRYASPTGTDNVSCTAASPCTITKAIEGAGPGDEVIVNPGDYPLTKTIADPAQITIHGVAGHPRPRLLFSGLGQDGLRLSHSSLLRYVEIDQAAAAGALEATGARVDQVIAMSPAWFTAQIEGGTVRNSIIVQTGTNGVALVALAVGKTSTTTYRNVTAISTNSGGIAIAAGAMAGGTATTQAINVIARGGPGGAGLQAVTDITGAHATVIATHSNWSGESRIGTNASIVNSGGNQSFAPSFVNAAAGDYRQAPGSVTIDAGVYEPINGAFDVDGDPRRVGNTDIGADELVPAPGATTGSVGVVTAGSATLSGSVDANGAPTTYRFEYGATTAYGHSTPATGAGFGTTAVAASATVSGLRPGTTYHYRLVATNAGGVTWGADRTFTTTSPAPTPPTTSSPPTAAPPTTPLPAFTGVRLASTRLTVARGRITLTLRCPTGTVGRCSGRTRLTGQQQRTGSRAASRVTLGRASFSIAPGKRATVRVRVSRAGRQLLCGVRRLRGRVSNAARDGAGQSKTTLAAVTIRCHR